MFYRDLQTSLISPLQQFLSPLLEKQKVAKVGGIAIGSGDR